MIKAIIVDDEPLAHDVLKHHLREHSDLQIVAQCANATEALAVLANQTIDLLFLDVQMPALTGIELLKVMANKPQVILVTAYKEYALEGFDLDVTDYLLKPVSAKRLSQAIDKVRARRKNAVTELESTANNTAKTTSHVTLKVDRSKQKFAIKDIDYIEAYGNYVKIWHASNATLVSSTLKNLLDEVPCGTLVQTHKSFAVNENKIQSVGTDKIILTNGSMVKVGKSFKRTVSGLL